MLIATNQRQAPSAFPNLLGLVGCVVVSLASALLLHLMGFWALVLPLYAVTMFAVVLYPTGVLTGLLSLAIIFEPGMFDYTEPISNLLYSFPPGWNLFITISPIEVLLLVAASSLVFRSRQVANDRLPYLVWSVPLVLLVGLLWGLRAGAPTNFAYHELRGLLFGMVIFVAVMRFPTASTRSVMVITVLSTLALGFIALTRYFTYLRTARVPSELAFAHETPAFLAIGIVISVALLFRGERGWRRVFLVAAIAFLFAAIIATERRAGTLVLMAGVASTFVLVFRSRPMLIGLMSIALLVATSVYVAAYWNSEYGAFAQPARALRSQISPSARDESSDTYRATEKFNVVETIRLNMVMGVGFGKPFIQFQPLPDMTAFWPLQSYVPHQNILWLWLKVGFLGLATLLAVVALAVRRIFRMLRGSLSIHEPEWVAGIVAGSIILMYLAYSTVDIALLSTRSIAPLAIALAVAFRLPQSPSEVTE